MATPSKEDVLTFELLVDIKASLKAMEQFNRTMQKSMKGIADTGERMGKRSEKLGERGGKATDKWVKSVERLNESYEYHDKLLQRRGNALRELRALYDKSDKEKRESLAIQIRDLEKIYKEELKIAKVQTTSRRKGGLVARSIAPGLRESLLKTQGPGGMKKALKSAGEKLKEPLESFLRRDVGGLIEKAGDGFSNAVARGFHSTRLLSRVGARSFAKRGERAIAAGQSAGGVKGSLQKAGGQGMKGLGSILGGIGKILRPLATLGPILQASVMGLIKLFIDLDAEVREFNKGIMESTSNLEFMAHAAQSVEGASLNMTDALDGARRAALDPAFNNALGITRDTHVAIHNALMQEGVAFGRLSAEAGKTTEGMKALSQEIVKTGIAYTRAFGVPISEVMSLQAEMIVEMGRSQDETRSAFAAMTVAAQESGIAGNKFFAIVRALSTDLGLFNLRLEDSVAVLGKIGKVMSPRNAQQFMQQAAQGLKSLGRQDRLKLSLYVGDRKTKEIVDKDLERRQAALFKKISGVTGEREDNLRARFESRGFAGIKNSIERLGEESGVIAQSAIQLETQKSRTKKGQYGYAQATGHMGVGASLEFRRASLLDNKIMGKTYDSIADAIGDLGIETVAENTGVSSEELESLATFEKAVDAQRETMAKTMGPLAAAAAGWDDVIDNMTAEMRKTLLATQDGRTIEQKMYDLAEKQGQETQSIQEKIANFINWVMNVLYDVIVDIFKAVSTLTPWGNDEIERQSLVYKSGDADMIKSYDTANSSGEFDPKVFLERYLPALTKKLHGVLGTSKEARQRVAQNVGSIDKTRAGEFGAEYEYAKRKQRIIGMAETMNLDAKKLEGLEKLLNSVGPDYTGDIDMMQVMKELNFTQEEQVRFLEQAGQGGSFLMLAELAKIVRDSVGEEPGAAPAGARPGASLSSGGAEVALEATNANLETANRATQHDQQRGIKLSPGTLKKEADDMETAMLSALRIALFEYYMYSGTDRGTLLSAMASGGVTDPRQMAAGFGAASITTGSPLGALEWLMNPTKADGNAAGGLVTGVGRGLAVVAAQGEGLASVGKGERILPAGGGGTGSGVNVVVNGVGGPDLARLIEGKVVEGIREYKRREKFN